MISIEFLKKQQSAA